MHTTHRFSYVYHLVGTCLNNAFRSSSRPITTNGLFDFFFHILNSFLPFCESSGKMCVLQFTLYRNVHVLTSVGLRYPRTGYPNRNRQFCKESEPEIWKKSIPGTESESAQYPKGTRRFLKYDWIAIITLFLVKLANW